MCQGNRIEAGTQLISHLIDFLGVILIPFPVSIVFIVRIVVAFSFLFVSSSPADLPLSLHGGEGIMAPNGTGERGRIQ
jgi:hypothetical protein